MLDKTGLNGKYDFELEFMFGFPAGTAAPGDLASDPGPDIAAAIQQQLGLRLVANKATIDVVVVDAAEKAPTAN